MSAAMVEHVQFSGGAQGGMHKNFRQATIHQSVTPYGMLVIKYQITIIAPAATGSTFQVVDNSIDFRDRWLTVQGIAAAFESAALAATWIPGGSWEKQLYGNSIIRMSAGFTHNNDVSNLDSPYVETGLSSPCYSTLGYGAVNLAHCMGYTVNGLTVGTSAPYFTLYGEQGVANQVRLALYVGATSGNLRARVISTDEVPSVTRFVAHGFVTVFSDEGHY